MSKNYQKPKSSGWIWLVAAGAVIIIVFAISRSSGSKSSDQYLTPVSSFADVHGLSIDPIDSSKVYIATHQGLFLLKDDKDLFRVGPAQDDYMGFSQDPVKPDTFYTAGHDSAMTGNKGFQRSDDGARSWKQTGLGANGQAEDFHSLALSPVDTSIVYGSAMGKLEKSTDGGSQWSVVTNAPSPVINLAVDPMLKDTVYAATSSGLMISQDQGNTWKPVSVSTSGAAVTAIAINPSNNQELLSYTPKLGLAKSTDGGGSWVSLSADFAKGGLYYLAYDKKTPSIVYAIGSDLGIYKTTDSGLMWKRMR